MIIKNMFQQYIEDNFTLDATSKRLISSILTYIEANASSAEDASDMLRYFLEGTIGLDDRDYAIAEKFLYSQEEANHE